MKRMLTISTIIFTVLCFAVASSVSCWYTNQFEGGMYVEYGLPLRWLIVHKHYMSMEEVTRTGEWFQTDRRSFRFAAFVCDVAVAMVASMAPTALTVTVWQRIRKSRNSRTKSLERTTGSDERLF